MKDSYDGFKDFAGLDDGTLPFVGVAFGPNVGNLIAWKADGSWKWRGTKGTIEWIEPTLDRLRIRSAAFGLQNAQVFVFTNGEFYWNLYGVYPDLLAILQRCRQGDVAFVALNQYRENEYFIVLANAEVHIRASTIVEQDIAAVLEAYPDMKVMTSTLVKRDTTISTRRWLPEKAKRKELMKGLANGVGSGLTATLITCAFGACSVM